jgi:hypothetical protein
MIRQIIIAAVLVALTTHADMEWQTAIGQKDQVTRGLVAYLAMRNSGTTVYDEWGAYNGTAVNGVTFATTHAAVGYGASFDGTNQYINVAASTVSSFPFSLTCWVKFTSSANTTVAMVGSSLGDSVYYGIGVDSVSQKLRIIGRDGGSFLSSLTASEYGNGAWHHCVAVFTSNTNKVLYVDGTSAATLSSSCAFSSCNIATVGRLARASLGSYFVGDVDEFRIYNVALSLDEVKQLYRMGAIPKGIK